MSAASMDEYKDLVIHATMMVVGAVGVYRRRNTMASLYLDARVWWNKHFGAPRKSALKQQEEEERVTRLRENGDDSTDMNEEIGLVTFADEASGVTVRSWLHIDDKRMLAVGNSAPFPDGLGARNKYQRIACPFVMLTYINDRSEEYTLDVDARLWYSIMSPTGDAGVPKFTRDEVMFLIGQAYPSDVSRIWTDVYVLECTTAEGKDVSLRNDQVMWTAVPKDTAASSSSSFSAAAEPTSSTHEKKDEEEKKPEQEDDDVRQEEMMQGVNETEEEDEEAAVLVMHDEDVEIAEEREEEEEHCTLVKRKAEAEDGDDHKRSKVEEEDGVEDDV